MSGDGNGDVSLAELQQRLATFKEQLGSMQELLRADPDNAEFRTIANDLAEVIRLTKEMIDLRVKPTPTPTTTVPDDNATQTKAITPLASTESHDEPDLAFAPGMICEALAQGIWFPARIESITAKDTYHVHYLGFGSKDELEVTNLRAITRPTDMAANGSLPAVSEIHNGFRCLARYYVDGQNYVATVTARTADGFQMLFDGYGNSEEVPYEYLSPLPPTADGMGASATASASISTATSAESGRQSAASTTAGVPALPPREAVVAKPIKVPEHLQVLPTDSEAERDRKRKRIKQINKLNKLKAVDNERNVKQHDWKSFQHRASKHKVRGSGVLSKRGTSMFASPDTVQGRVGVMGSGQGMTSFDDSRKKLKREVSSQRSTS